MRKLIVLDGGDGLGKTTQTYLLRDRLGAKLVVQPSQDNSLGWIRREVLNDTTLSPLECQLLHTLSHVVDMWDLQYFNSTPITVMDRSQLSTAAYSHALGIPRHRIDTLLRIHRDCWSRMNYFGVHYEVHIVLLDRAEAVRSEPDNPFETLINQSVLRDAYRTLIYHPDPFFQPGEQRHHVPVMDTPAETHYEILKRIGEYNALSHFE